MENENGPIILRDLFALALNSEIPAWRHFREGVEIHPIYTDNAGCSAALLRYAPGSSVPVHKHTGYEHILIISGEQSDGQRRYQSGDLIISRPGSTHAITSDSGCIVLAVWEKPVSFI